MHMTKLIGRLSNVSWARAGRGPSRTGRSWIILRFSSLTGMPLTLHHLLEGLQTPRAVSQERQCQRLPEWVLHRHRKMYAWIRCSRLRRYSSFLQAIGVLLQEGEN
jgi:hypothetical protein